MAPATFCSSGKTAGIIVEKLGAPTVVALQEIQDDTGPTDDGIVGAEQTLTRLVEGMPAAIAIDPAATVRTSRSTVGTMTEVTDYVKILFARLGVLHCASCGQPVVPETPQAIWARLRSLPTGSRLVITFPLVAGLLEDEGNPAAIRHSLRRLAESVNIEPKAYPRFVSALHKYDLHPGRE